MPTFFIDRPVFAWVIAILITLLGVIAISRVAVESYPEIAPPQVSVSATYPGANADTVERTVTQVIEQQLTGLDHLLYFTSTSNSQGSSSITLAFESGTDPDIAAVQTQNRVSLAQPRLPAEVIQQGIVVAKSNPGFLLAVGLQSDDGRLDSWTLNNVLATRVIDQISRIQGVGTTQLFGSEFGMRIWLNPDKLHAFGIAAAQVLTAVQGQNVQFPVGSIGALPATTGQLFTAPVMAEGRFTTPEQFENIILRANPNGTTVRVKDVATVGLGPASYGRDIHYGRKGVGGFAVLLQPGADALKVAQNVKDKMNELKPTFPPNCSWSLAYDSTTFVKISIREVVYTLIAAVVLVFIVMLVFLQTLRATLIPTLVMPVALMGAFIGMWAFGFTINQLTLFGMVLAIGIVVDDAIVVIESVERIMREEHLSPKEATRKAMSQITSAIITITVVLAAVFVPSALQTGSVGVIYRQFALTIAVSMLFSAFLALSFTPALCASLMRPTHLKPNVVFRWFNVSYNRVQSLYTTSMAHAVRRMPIWMASFAIIVVLGAWLFMRLPSSFVPDEDQGNFLVLLQTPAGSTLERTNEVLAQTGDIIQKNPDVESVFVIAGFSYQGNGESLGLEFVQLKDWSKRKKSSLETIQWVNRTLGMQVKNAQVFAVNQPTIRGLSQFGGFDFYLEDRIGLGRPALAAAEQTLLQSSAQRSALSNVRANDLDPAPRLDLAIDRVQAQSMGLSATDVYTALQLMLAPVYVNDFFHEGRVMRVMMQAAAPYRMGPEALQHFYVPIAPTASGTAATPAASVSADPLAGPGGTNMVPLSTVVRSSWTVAAPALTRYNGFPAIEITGGNSPGHSSGEAMNELQGIVQKQLPSGFGFDWAGQSLQELVSGAEAPMLFTLSILIVFLCLAALYESWSTPVAVMLAVPVGILGAVAAVMIRGLPNDVFFKVGLITIIGLAAKNAILIVEFAVEEREAGKTVRQAVLEAARLRFRPIMMTSFAFILGVMPLVVSTGAGANARHAIGTGVAGGMVTASMLGVLLIPVFYVAVRRMLGEKLDDPPRSPPTG